MTLIRTIAAFLLILGLAAPTYAHECEPGHNHDTGVNVGGGVDASVGGVVDVDADASADVSVDSGDQTQGDGSADGASDSDPRDTSAGAGFSLSRSDDSVRSGSESSMSASSVNSDSDLEVFAASTLRSDDSFDGVDVSSDRLSFRYKEDARLFGFIPHKVTTRVEVSGDGTVRVTRPWYSFLVAGLSNETSASIESRVRTALANSSGSMDARTKALVLSEIASALTGSASASANVMLDARTEGGSADTDAGGSADARVIAPN